MNVVKNVVKTKFYLTQLKNILMFIALDNPYAALGFEKELNAKLDLVKHHPEMCRASKYMSEDSYRDLIHQGYTIIYKIKQHQILLLNIFKWQQR